MKALRIVFKGGIYTSTKKCLEYRTGDNHAITPHALIGIVRYMLGERERGVRAKDNDFREACSLLDNPLVAADSIVANDASLSHLGKLGDRVVVRVLNRFQSVNIMRGDEDKDSSDANLPNRAWTDCKEWLQVCQRHGLFGNMSPAQVHASTRETNKGGGRDSTVVAPVGLSLSGYLQDVLEKYNTKTKAGKRIHLSDGSWSLIERFMNLYAIDENFRTEMDEDGSKALGVFANPGQTKDYIKRPLSAMSTPNMDGDKVSPDTNLDWELYLRLSDEETEYLESNPHLTPWWCGALAEWTLVDEEDVPTSSTWWLPGDTKAEREAAAEAKKAAEAAAKKATKASTKSSDKIGKSNKKGA